MQNNRVIGLFLRGDGMTIREQQEQWEHEYLVQGASFSDESRGKEREEALCDIRTIYQRDRDRILHCKTFRRLYVIGYI